MGVNPYERYFFNWEPGPDVFTEEAEERGQRENEEKNKKVEECEKPALDDLRKLIL